MIYIDSSVALAYLLAESRAPAARFWDNELVSSRLLQFEIWNRIHARQLGQSLGGAVRAVLDGVELIALSEAVLTRALEPWPMVVRTLDSLHLATLEYLRRAGAPFELASYDDRLSAAAGALGIPLAAL